MFSKEATNCRRLLSPCALASFENQKITKFRIGGVQFMKLQTWIIQKGAHKELLWEQNGPTLPRQKKKQTAKNLDFLSTKKSQRFCPQKKSEEKKKKNFNNQAPRPKTYPKISTPRCYPTLASASQPLHLCPTFEDVPQFSWGVQPRVVVHLLSKVVVPLKSREQCGKNVGKSRERCRFSFIKE